MAQRQRRTGILSTENIAYFIIFEISVSCVQTEVCLDAGDCWCEELLSSLVMCKGKSPEAVLHIYCPGCFVEKTEILTVI